MMFAFLQLGGMLPWSRDFLQIRKMGTDNEPLHSFRSLAGKLSGPAAELGDSSFIASSMSSISNEMLSKDGLFDSCDDMKREDISESDSLGLLKTDEYCSDRISLISLASAVRLPDALSRGPMPTRTFEKR